MNFMLLAASPGFPVFLPRLCRLEGAGEILVDRWGLHIYAQNEHDLFFAQGYTAARPHVPVRIWRRQATGTVAEILGRRELNRDIGAASSLPKDMKQELAHYHPRRAHHQLVRRRHQRGDRRDREDPSLLPWVRAPRESSRESGLRK
jgi:acyl-homoserine lactone acylase PvdQ